MLLKILQCYISRIQYLSEAKTIAKYKLLRTACFSRRARKNLQNALSTARGRLRIEGCSRQSGDCSLGSTNPYRCGQSATDCRRGRKTCARMAVGQSAPYADNRRTNPRPPAPGPTKP